MATQDQNICSLPEDVRFYLLRGNTMVPLIPADQLPFQLKGIPRQLTHRQMSDQGWKLFKETRDAASILSVQAPVTNDRLSHCSLDGKPQYLAPDHNVRTESQSTSTAFSRTGRLSPQSPYDCLGTPSTTGSERQSSLADAVASVYHREGQRSWYNHSNPSPEPSKKIYCTYWIATGDCRWMHTGCKYKHEIPGTEKLRELGFTRGTPRWWSERNAVSPAKPLTWMQRKVGGGAGSQNLEPPAEENIPPCAPSFADATTLRPRRFEDRFGSGGEVQKIGGGVSKRRGSAEHSTASSTITPNLIDLDDTPSPPPSPSTAESGETRTPLSRTSSSSPPASPRLPRKAPLTKSLRRKMRPTSSSSFPSSSSSQEDDSETETETENDSDDAPATPVATAHRQRRSKRDSSAAKATSAARRVTGNEAKLSLASSKYAVKIPRAQREARGEVDRRKGDS